MTTKIGTGASSNRDTTAALKEALGHALWKLDGKSASFGFLFLGPKHDTANAAALAQKQLGSAPLLTSTTAGELTELGWSHDGLVVMLVASDSFEFKANFASGLRAQVANVAERLCNGLADTKRAAQVGGRRHMTSVLLTDGLAGTGEDLVQQMFELMHSVPRIVGGAAGDEAKFERTLVGLGSTVAPDSAVALHVFSRKPWGIGVDHGLRPTSTPMRVTRAIDNIVHEIDGAPAFDAYRAHAAKRGMTLTQANASAYMIANEIGIHFFERITRARAPLSTDAKGALTCAASIPEGSMISILDGEPDSMIQAARRAAESAKAGLEGAEPAGVLLFDCVCRGMILKDAFRREIEAVRSVFGDVPVAGFLTYGEIARRPGHLDGWHNATAVVAAIPAD
jgi:hypothetical protein